MITLEEMTSYLTSVFKIIHETDSEKFDELGVSPEELASVTAEQVFEDTGALLDAYRNMSFKAYKIWYTQSPDSEGIGEAAAVSRVTGIKEIGRLTGLDKVSVNKLMEQFRSMIGATATA